MGEGPPQLLDERIVPAFDGTEAVVRRPLSASILRLDFAQNGLLCCGNDGEILAAGLIVVQSSKEASQTRDYCVAKHATLRAARPDPLRLRSGQAFAAQRTLAQG